MTYLKFFFILLASLILTGCYGEVYHPNANRQSGEPLDGVWYLARRGGCYESGPIFKFEGKKAWFHTHHYYGKVFDINETYWNHNVLHLKVTEYHPTFPEDNDRVENTVLDTGNKLEFLKYRKNGGKLTGYRKGRRVFVRCGKYSFKEWLFTSIGYKQIWRGLTDKNAVYREFNEEELKKTRRMKRANR